MADYSRDVTAHCMGHCGKTIQQDWADRSKYICTDCRKARVWDEFDRMMGDAMDGIQAQQNVMLATIERLLVLEGKLPR